MQTSTESARKILQPTSDSVLRLVQVTDCHILENAADSLRGMNTRSSFEAVCRAIQRDQNALDLLLATGDLSQDASPASYQYLAEHFDSMRLPLFWLPGNHDDPALMREWLRGEMIFPAKQIAIGNWNILLLDSTIAGESSGHLAPAQIDFLQTTLAAERQAHVLVCLHHQALPAGSEWIDQLGLQPAEQLADIVKKHANVRAVLWGHVHQSLDQRRDGIDWMSTPSTCMQFKPGSKTFALDTLAPGYREIELHANGRVVSSVRRIDDTDFNACSES
jgi:3',5'-cyclic-AMP phosphodiesterase